MRRIKEYFGASPLRFDVEHITGRSTSGYQEVIRSGFRLPRDSPFRIPVTEM
ncbi:MAG: hypothetical protein LBM08_09460 [Dysgonamonadaceae bacterium]|nr:hypothetical protein [Dysgonamonadaceae bacterium]